MAKKLPKEYYQLLEEIQVADFVLFELRLYLDTHPTDSGAIQQYNQYLQFSKQLKQKYELSYGPINYDGLNHSNEYWMWKSGPWPWQV